MRRWMPVVAAAFLLPAVANANAPAPWWACDGLSAGDTCGDGVYYDGTCEAQGSTCTDDASTSVDECLWCTGARQPGEDAGTAPDEDAGVVTAPEPDAGRVTAPAPDAGGVTAPAPDAGGTTAPAPDAATGALDAGGSGSTSGGGGGSSGGCSAVHMTTGGGTLLLLLLGAIAAMRRRRSAVDLRT